MKSKTPLPPKHQTGSIGELQARERGALLQKHIRTLLKIALSLGQSVLKGPDLDMDELKIYVAKDKSADRLEKQTNDKAISSLKNICS